MSAVVPLNVTAVRVSSPDKTNVTNRFAGSTAAFDDLPHGESAKQASTGDTVWRPLERDNPPSDALDLGIHLHWELPEHFKRGSQDPDTGAITFPHAPTRWLVVRTLSTGDAGGALRHKRWIVESDYVSPTRPPDPDDPDRIARPAIAVPLAAPDGTPNMFMGRVVDADGWDPAAAEDTDYLPAYTGPDGKSLYLTSIGFVGAAFAGYYPDCRSVFGFWDTFADLDDPGDIRSLIVKNQSTRFSVSYTVVGWLPDPKDDPLHGLGAAVREEYAAYVAHCAAEKVDVTQKPVDVFRRIASQRFDWEFSENAMSCTLDGTTLTDLTVPETTLCAGVVQDVVWNAGNPSTDTPFLAAPGGGAKWTDTVDIAVGNTTIEAISALVKSHLAPPGGEGVLANYEMLLDALQLGLLRDLAAHGNSLVALEQQRHAKSFSQVDGGHVWTLQATATPDSPETASPQLTLPVELAEQLAALNTAQQAYDQGRERVNVMRRQLFMDWIVFVKQLVSGDQSPVDTDDLRDFITASQGGELDAVVNEGADVGLLHYEIDTETGKIAGISSADGDTLAKKAVDAYDAVKAALPAPKPGQPHFAWQLEAVPAAPFWLPTDPVLAIEGARMDPVRRNGDTRAIAVRADSELVTTLELAAGSTLAAASLKDLPAPPAGLADGVAAVLGEAALLDPLWADAIAAAAGGGANAAAIAAAQGGSSGLDGPQDGGLFGAVRAAGYERKPNPTSTVQAPAQLTVTFTNAAKTALAPDPVAWNAQTVLPAFAGRADPFLPVWMTWSVRLDPLLRGTDAGYAPTALEDSFALDADAIDLTYKPPETFTTGKPVRYRGAVVLSKKPMASLTQQIDRYVEDFPSDAADAQLRAARDDFANRKVMSQALGTLSIAQTLRTTIPQIQVQNLVSDLDLLTDAIADAANATKRDSWYDTGFNALTPISSGLQAQYNYGPLRSGFLEITKLRIIDAFGQIMDLTAPKTASGALTVTSSIDLSPVSGDSGNIEKAYLPPRALAPSRFDARWLSAVHDFVESNDHPATSPVCGWIVPNHLEISLAFYDADGSEIGSFGLEHGDNVYRTRAGNLANLHDDLETDLLPVNPHIATLMRFVAKRKDAGQLLDLMATIERSDHFVQPANGGQDVSLSVLVGRPLAVTRCALSLSTAGGVLPISQANTSADDALAQTVQNAWYDYRDRQAHTSAGLDKVKIPLRLGDLTDTDDGLVAFLPEPYSTVFSSAAPDTGANGVVKPDPNTVELLLNAPTATLVTAIVDPRAPVHVTTGVLPTVTLQIPPEQYVRAMQQLAVTFTTRPVLRDQLELRLPLPAEAGFDWWWVSRGKAPVALSASPSTDVPIYGYGPRRLLEGWLDLMPTPPSPPSNGKGQS